MQVIVEKDSMTDKVFFWFDIVITILFSVELAINLWVPACHALEQFSMRGQGPHTFPSSARKTHIALGVPCRFANWLIPFFTDAWSVFGRSQSCLILNSRLFVL